MGPLRALRGVYMHALPGQASSASLRSELHYCTMLFLLLGSGRRLLKNALSVAGAGLPKLGSTRSKPTAQPLQH